MKPAWWSPRPGDAVKRHGFWVEAVAIWRTLRETAQRDSESCQLLEAGWTPVGGWMPLSMVNFANLGENIGRSRWIWDVKKNPRNVKEMPGFTMGRLGDLGFLTVLCRVLVGISIQLQFGQWQWWIPRKYRDWLRAKPKEPWDLWWFHILAKLVKGCERENSVTPQFMGKWYQVVYWDMTWYDEANTQPIYGHNMGMYWE